MMTNTYSGHISKLKRNEIFVFGSNTEGRHGKGAAKKALDLFDAEYGNARGLQGQSYAICTKNLTKYHHPSVKAVDIKSEIFNLYNFALVNSHLKFYVAYTDSPNLNGYSPQEMADMFSSWNHISDIPTNIIFQEDFAKLLTSQETLVIHDR